LILKAHASAVKGDRDRAALKASQLADTGASSGSRRSKLRGMDPSLQSGRYAGQESSISELKARGVLPSSSSESGPKNEASERALAALMGSSDEEDSSEAGSSDDEDASSEAGSSEDEDSKTAPASSTNSQGGLALLRRSGNAGAAANG